LVIDLKITERILEYEKVEVLIENSNHNSSTTIESTVFIVDDVMMDAFLALHHGIHSKLEEEASQQKEKEEN